VDAALGACSAWKSPEFRNVFKSRSDISQLFGRLRSLQLRSNSDIREFYLGLNEAGSRKSYRDVKRYMRRKRWLS
jgi:hypothetical protein